MSISHPECDLRVGDWMSSRPPIAVRRQSPCASGYAYECEPSGTILVTSGLCRGRPHDFYIYGLLRTRVPVKPSRGVGAYFQDRLFLEIGRNQATASSAHAQVAGSGTTTALAAGTPVPKLPVRSATSAKSTRPLPSKSPSAQLVPLSRPKLRARTRHVRAVHPAIVVGVARQL